MNKKTVIIIALQAFIIIVLFWLLVFYGKDEYEEVIAQDEQPEEIETASMVLDSSKNTQGVATLVLPVNVQKQSEIKTTALTSAQHSATLESFGNVVNVSTLIDARGRYLTATNDANVAQIRVNNSLQEFKRMQLLNQDDKNISDRALASIEATLKNDQASVKTAQQMANIAKSSVQQEWGETLSNWAMQNKANKDLDGLLNQSAVLIRVSLPFGTPAPSKGDTIVVSPVGSHEVSITAKFVSVAPQSDSNIQGSTYFYIASAETLRAGMRLSIERQDTTQAAKGVMVPHQAVVWHANQAWVYEKVSPDKFVRKPIKTEIEIENGWFSQSFKVGDLVVTSGAQLLLSEEFKSQITNENDD